MSEDFTFQNGHLVPITNPIAEDGDWIRSMKAYGFSHTEGTRIGPEFGVHIEIVGPAAGEVSYPWVCYFSNGEWVNLRLAQRYGRPTGLSDLFLADARSFPIGLYSRGSRAGAAMIRFNDGTQEPPLAYVRLSATGASCGKFWRARIAAALTSMAAAHFPVILESGSVTARRTAGSRQKGRVDWVMCSSRHRGPHASPAGRRRPLASNRSQGLPGGQRHGGRVSRAMPRQCVTKARL